MKPERVCEVSLSSDLPTLSLLTPIPQNYYKIFPLLNFLPPSPKTHHSLPPREASQTSIQDCMKIISEARERDPPQSSELAF